MFWPTLDSESRTGPVVSSRVESRHVPVMVAEVMELLDVQRGRHYVDFTVGGGGHAETILDASAPDGHLMGFDRDSAAVRRSEERLRRFGRRVRILHGELAKAPLRLSEAALPRIHGVLIDCGVSSEQLEDPRRGFSFDRSGPLDMRMDPTVGRTAEEWLAHVHEKELADVLFRFGEERFSRRIARAIVAARKRKRISTTGELADIVRSALPSAVRSRSIHPATRTFQAIRIRINDELAQLEKGLNAVVRVLPAEARVAVISFHSLEDRIVKNVFRAAARESGAKILTPKPIRPTRLEIDANPRARSARLRGLKIQGEAA
ncbi:MAG TPA: 16S rRNA (cytosine(1402)-N(4))-methyltransferase RsmH [Bdellovibrionota bacterium]|nr:16S rRNA (cytosine(1402)-N(4))-methyltransferase RsmH [Bdellovibrionota bacterium]